MAWLYPDDVMAALFGDSLPERRLDPDWEQVPEVDVDEHTDMVLQEELDDTLTPALLRRQAGDRA